MSSIRTLLSGLAVALAAHSAAAAEFPQRLVRIVGSAGAGSALDLYGRAYVDAMREAWGQPVIFDPKGAATGMVATREVAKAAPDGHTLLLTSINHVLNPVVRGASAGYNPVADFEPVALVVKHPLILITNPGFEAQSFADLLARARRQPDQLVYGSPGIGSINHLAMEAIKSRSGVAIRHIPFTSSPAALTGVLGGEVPIMVSNLVTALPQIESGKARALAVTSPARLPFLAQVPAVNESIPGMVLESWYAVLAPAGTPRDVIDKVGAAIRKVSEQPEFKAKVAATGGQSQFVGPDEFRKLLASEVDMWTRVVKEANIPRE